METITYKSIRMDCWDVGGQEAVFKIFKIIIS